MYETATHKSIRKINMAQKKQKVFVRGADGREKELILLRVAAKTAYVCPAARYAEAVGNPELWVGFPLADVRSATGEPLAA
jgi:hypothetical protein